MKNIFKQLFVPHKDNDHKPHILREFFILVFLFIAIFTFANSIFLSDYLSKNKFLAAIYSGVIADLANEDRSKENLAPLAINELLSKAASLKALDMANKGYFAHNSPEGLTPWYWFNKAGYEFVYAGENLAINFDDSKNVEDAWMLSPLHRANILNGHFTDIGIGIAHGIYQGKETTFVVQMFGSKKTIVLDQENAIAKNFETDKEPSKQVSLENIAKTPDIKESTSTQEKFVEVKNVKGEFTEKIPSSVEEPQKNLSRKYSFLEKFLVNQRKNSYIIYLFLASLIIFSLAFFLFVERRREHNKSIISGILLFVIIFGVIYISNIILFPGVLVL